MKVLIVGSGGREHALAWRLASSPHVSGLWVADGNAGTGQIAANLKIHPENVTEVTTAASDLGIDLVVVGPEQPLANGIVDWLTAKGIPTFGPTKGAAQLEASKSFAREVIVEAGAPGPDFRVFDDRQEGLDFLSRHNRPVAVKADGLAGGKGVTLCATAEEAAAAVNACMVDRVFGAAGTTVVIEELLQGVEVSVFGFSDGERLSDLVAACDYKQVGDGDTGPNTGGMGSFTPPPFWNAELSQEVAGEIMQPVITAMANRGVPYRGILYAGLMFTREGPKVLEINCRFGDPEAQVILPLLESDPVEAMLACCRGDLSQTSVGWSDQAYVGIVMVSGGYPGNYHTGKEITGLELSEPGVMVFHAGTQPTDDGANEKGPIGLDSRRKRRQVVSAGGRVLTVVGQGESLAQARERAYRRAEKIDFEGAYFRRDIGDLAAKQWAPAKP